MEQEYPGRSRREFFSKFGASGDRRTGRGSSPNAMIAISRPDGDLYEQRSRLEGTLRSLK